MVVADDELPAVDELAYLLSLEPQVAAVHTATRGAQVLELLKSEHIDAVFLDIHMPAVSGLAIARVLSEMVRPPVVVFVTADEAHALAAYDLAAVDYLLKPVRPERLAEAVRRICELTNPSSTDPDSAELITVNQGGVSKLIRRDEVRYVQAQGDYARLHTAETSYLVRVPLADLVEQWESTGFHRIHRSYLVSLRSVDRVRTSGGRASVDVGGTLLPVSRRHLPAFRNVLKATRIRSRS
ncbi:LytTR family DNA-binding domain-containing protein [Arthrobacter roseus]